ncbi:MAG TPA: START domain-containing protein [Aquabacterium sp.]|uniref:START domain-containing protein n=1 Tax=Aquabacterium sp. TaxID=1872578 RepID=UPI002E3576DA|nr:START domain-containing protein [Aquabacterium sp.]HEX5374166.1 START domain-containing protein [Aquabacterium sp.]
MSVMRRLTLWGLLFSVLIMGRLAQAAPSTWEPVRKSDEREGIQTWVRPVEGQSIKAFRGVTEMPHSALAVLALIADIPHLHKWVYQCRSARQLKDRPPEQTYTRFRGIWPASDRDVLLTTQVYQQDDGSIVVDSRQVDGYPLSEDFVRMPSLHNTFRLTPLKARWTRIEFETQVDVGGMIPSWLANLVATDAPLHTLQGMRKRLDDHDKYQIQSVDELPTYYLQGKPLVFSTEHLGARPEPR